jgi:hypothetical protein
MKLRHIIVFFLFALSSRESIAAADSISVTIDTLCDGWRICVTDNSDNGGIDIISCRDDEYGNCMISSEYSGNGYLYLPNNPKSYCFEAKKRWGYYTATVRLDVCRKNGECYSQFIIDSSKTCEITPLVYFHYSFGDLTYNQLSEGKIVIRKPKFSDTDLLIKSVSLGNLQTGFSIKSISSQLPVSISSNDSLSITLNFLATKIGWVFDTILIVNACRTESVLLAGSILSGMINCSDIDFGDVFVGDTSCVAVRIVNTGTDNYAISRTDVIRSTGNNISYKPDTTKPVYVTPNSSFDFQFCYAPKKPTFSDTLVVRWKTDIDSILLQIMKDSAVVHGRAISPEIKWDVKKLEFQIDSNSPSFQIANFINFGPPGPFVKRFYISGKDSAEFSILNSLSPLSNVTMLRNETNWFDITFKPDMTKPLPERYAHRHATLVAELADSNVSMELIGTFNPLHVTRELALEDFSFSPNPVFGQDAILSFTLAEPKQLAISIYDMLGREVTSIPLQYYSSGSYSNAIGTSKLVDGSYILRVDDGVATKSIRFSVVK